MKILKTVIKNNQKYEFVKRNNEETFLYKNKKYEWVEMNQYDILRKKLWMKI